MGAASLLFAGMSPAMKQKGEKQLRVSCIACHGLDAIQARRLSREDWNLEVGKMETMGAPIRNRKLLLDYLEAVYGPKSKPTR